MTEQLDPVVEARHCGDSDMNEKELRAMVAYLAGRNRDGIRVAIFGPPMRVARLILAARTALNSPPATAVLLDTISIMVEELVMCREDPPLDVIRQAEQLLKEHGR